jgi:enamine deaminase RidA (YjgF/YER057c/UK114 family)
MMEANDSTVRADEAMEVTRTVLGDVIRLDIAGVGARLPAALRPRPDEGPPGAVAPGATAQHFARAQNVAICDALTGAAAAAGGGFDSLAEWTVLYASGGYDGADMRGVRRARFRPGYRAAITTLGAADPRRGWGVRVNGVAYVARRPGALDLRLWQPAALYTTEQMVLAPATVASFGGARQIYFSGLVAWDRQLNVLHADAPRRQVRHVLELLEACLTEQGGDRSSVLRLRPFTHSPEMGALIREEIDAFWRGLAPPSVCLFDGTSFGHPPRLHMELQAVAVLPDPVLAHSGGQASGEPGAGASRPTICRHRAGALDLASIAELTVSEAAGDADAQAARLVEQLSACAAAGGLSVDDVRRVFAYVTSDAVEGALRRRLRAVTGAVLHAVPVASLSAPVGPPPTVRAEALAARAVS